MNATPVSPRAFLHTDGAYNQNVIAKTKLTDVDMTKLIKNKVAFTNEQISTMNEKQLRYALNALMPSFVEQTKNNKAFAEVPLLIEKAQKTSDIKGMRDYVKMMQAQVATIDETSNALITNVEGYQLRDEGDGGRIEVEVDDNGIEYLSDISFKTIERPSAEETNRWWDEMKGYDPPYMPNTETRIIELVNEGHFVRVYDKINSKKQGSWLMLAEDIKGLTSMQIQNKYALPFEPIYICDVFVEPHQRLRVGYANRLYGFKGNGLQFDLMDQWIGRFGNERIIEEEQ